MTNIRSERSRGYKRLALSLAVALGLSVLASLTWVGVARADHVCQLNPEPSFSVSERGSVSLPSNSANCHSVNWDLDNDGAYDDGSDSTITFAAGDRDGPGSQIVGIEGVRSDRVCDPEIHACWFEDDFAYAETTVNIVNAPPTATGINTSPLTINEGSTFSFSLANPTDVSDVDKGSLQYRFNCGSGYGTFSTMNSRSCPTSAAGIRTVKGQVRDKDGGVSAEYTKTVRILPLLRITDRSVTEGNSGTKSAVFTVRLSSASQQRVTVNYATANGTAKAPGDYTVKSGTLSFSAGETAKTISIAVKGERLKEPNETFFVRLSGATNAAIADASGQGTIINND
jgi:hypothetical protein